MFPCGISDERIARETDEADWVYVMSEMEEVIEKTSEAGQFCGDIKNE